MKAENVSSAVIHRFRVKRCKIFERKLLVVSELFNNGMVVLNNNGNYVRCKRGFCKQSSDSQDIKQAEHRSLILWPFDTMTTIGTE